MENFHKKEFKNKYEKKNYRQTVFRHKKKLPKKRNKNMLNFMLVFLKTDFKFFYNLNSYLKQKTLKLYIL